MELQDLHVLERHRHNDQNLERLPDGTYRSAAWQIDARRHRSLQRIFLHASHARPSFLAGTIREFREVMHLRGDNIRPQRRYEVIFEPDATLIAARMPVRSGERAPVGYGPDPPSPEEVRLRAEIAMLRTQLDAARIELAGLHDRVRSLTRNARDARGMSAVGS